MPRFLVYLFAIPLVLVLVGFILVSLLLDKEKILDLAAEELKAKTGATLAVGGAAELSFFPRLGLSLEQVALDMPGEQQTSLQARSLEIGVQLMPLLSKQVAIDSILLDGVLVSMTTEPAPAPVDTSALNDEQLARFYQQREAAREAAGKATGAENVLAIPLALEVARLQITDSRLEVREAGSDTQVIDIASLTVRELNLEGRSIPVEASITVAGEQAMELSLRGKVMINQDTQVIGLETLDIELGGALQAPVTMTTSGEVDINRQVADLNLVANISDTRAEGQLRYASFESPQVDAQLRLNRFTPALLALAGPEAAAAESAPAGGEAASDETDVPLPLDALRLMDTRADLVIEEVIWGSHRVQQLKAKLRVLNGEAIFPSITGTIHGGSLDMKASLNAKQSTARINTQGTLLQLDIASVLAAAEVEPVLSGRANLDWKLHGKGNTSGAISQTLRGPLNLRTEQAVLQGLGVEQMLCESVALVNREALSADFPADSAFEELAVTLQLGKGKARLQPLTARLPDISLSGEGEIDIASLDFDTTFSARLSPGLEQLDPACRVNERITAIAWPVNCRGNATGDPADWCAVDSKEILEDLAGNELKRKAQKEVEEKYGEEAGALLKGLLGD
ncbi:AsmA family protein [Seongchinamella sediminis]|uniref:AsmA family protein n=1 Tax=Seongchinamella sediminis TaxID=2283635 RepID=A0A3L7E197_9GAMM|nr:AsmA family protein [Seongchinamella sediminis]RLQ23306.1 AsmA family protein [Seongchinamella sediminis]